MEIMDFRNYTLIYIMNTMKRLLIISNQRKEIVNYHISFERLIKED